MEVLNQPLSKIQMANMANHQDGDGYIRGNISVGLNEIIELRHEEFLDLISEKLTDTDILMDISYTLVGVKDGECVIEVVGDPESILDEFPYNIQVGDELTWNDPDDGICSKTGEVLSINWIGEDAIQLTMTDGWEAEVRPDELS